MALESCPKCLKNTLIRTPHGVVNKEFLDSLVKIAEEYSFDCLNKDCNYTSGRLKNEKKQNSNFF